MQRMIGTEAAPSWAEPKPETVFIFDIHGGGARGRL